MQKYKLISQIKPLPNEADLQPLERLAEIGYRPYTFGETRLPNQAGTRIEFYIREGYSPESLTNLKQKTGVLAIFRDKKGTIDFLVIYDDKQGQVSIAQSINDCKEIESKALRQGVISWPPRFLREDHLREYGLLYTGIFYVAASVGAFWYGADLLGDKQTQKKFFEFLKEYPEIIPVSMVSYVFGFLTFALFGKWFGPAVGSIGDRMRVKHMSDKALEYKFGVNALESVKLDLREAESERDITRFFDIKNGRDGSFFRQELLHLFERMRNSEK